MRLLVTALTAEQRLRLLFAWTHSRMLVSPDWGLTMEAPDLYQEERLLGHYI